MAKQKSESIDLTEFLTGIRDLIDGMLDGGASGKAKAAPEPEPGPEEQDTAVDVDKPSRSDRQADLQKRRINTLRKIALDLGFNSEDVEDADKETLIDGILDDEYGDADDADDAEDAEPDEDASDEEDADEPDDEDGEEEESASGYDRDELEEMSLKEIRVVAKDAGYTTADLKGMDQDAIIDMLMESDDEPDADEDEEDEDEPEEEGYSEEDLEGMNLRELKSLAKEWGVKVPAGTNKAGVIELLVDED